MKKNGLSKQSIALLHIGAWLLILELLFGLADLYYGLQDLWYKKNVEIDDAFLLIPFMLILFYWNSEYLIPRFLSQKNWGKYLIGLLLGFAIVILTTNQIFHLIEHKGYAFRVDQEEFLDATILVAIIILFAGSSWGISKIARKNSLQAQEAKEKQKEAELKFLNNQFNPHFLFNTINGLYSLAIEEEATKTTDSILKLSDIIRYPIKMGEEKSVPLNMEISFIEDYIALNILRLGEDYPIHFDKEGDFENIEIAPLLFIPIVENAFKYGVSPLKRSAIHFSLSISDGILQFKSENHIVKEDQLNSHQIGFQNLRQRLKLLYSEKHHFESTEVEKTYYVDLQIHLK